MDLMDVGWLKFGFLFLLVGFSVKMGVVPLFNVDIDAKDAAPSHIAALLSSVLMNAGFTDISFLPPRTIIVRSAKNLFRKILVKALHQILRFCFYIQDYTVPKNLDKNIVVTARKP